MAWIGARVLVMDTKDIHPMTEAMTEILINRVGEAMVENKLPHDYLIIVLASFLADYENHSLMKATYNLLSSTRDIRKQTEPWFDLTMEEIDALSAEDKTTMKSWVQMGIVHSLLLEAVTELVAPLGPNGRD